MIEADICGGGPSGRNGGFATGWWDELPRLIERHGSDGALAIARAIDAAVDDIGAWCAVERRRCLVHEGGLAHGERGTGPGRRGPRRCRGVSRGSAWATNTSSSRPTRSARAWCSPVFRGGVFMRGAATMQPAVLARGLRARPPRARRDDPRGHDRGVELDGERPGVLGWIGAAGRRAAAGRAGRPVRVRTTSARGDGEVIAALRGRRAERLGGGLAILWPPARDLVELHRPDRTDPGSARRDWLDRRRRPGRRAVHASLPPHDAAMGGSRLAAAAVEQVSVGGSGRSSPTTWSPPSEPRPVFGGSSRRLRDVRIDDAWGGPIDITSDHLPMFASVPGARSTTATATRAMASRQSLVGGRILAALALERADDPVLALPLVGAVPRRVPARTVPVRWRAHGPRGDRAHRAGGGAWRAAVARASGAQPDAAAHRATTSGPNSDA